MNEDAAERAIENIERKYQMTKLGKGDYIFPSNDRSRLWRIRSYLEGPSTGLLDWSRDRQVWGGSIWTGPIEELPDFYDDENRWNFRFGMCATRDEAIQQALRDTSA